MKDDVMDTRAFSVSARDGRPPDGVGPNEQRATMLVGDGLRKVAVALSLVLLLIVAGWIAALVLCSSARAQTPYHFELFSAPAGEMTMTSKLTVGPFDQLSTCYAVGALSIDTLSKSHPDKVFMGRCDGGILLTGRAIVDRALALLPRERAR